MDHMLMTLAHPTMLLHLSSDNEYYNNEEVVTKFNAEWLGKI